MIVLKILSKLFKALRSNESPNQLAWGFVLGMIIGLTPFWNLHNLIVIVLIIVLKVNAAMSIAAFLVFSLFAYLLDPLFHSLGYSLLVNEGLKPLWVFIASTPVLAWSNLNNTVVLGSFLVAILLIFPLLFFTKWWVQQYRDRIDARMSKWKIVQVIKGSKLYQLYEKISRLGD
jgi:uncharacterized protein (TIGR03546 family)